MTDIWAGQQVVESPNVFIRLTKAVNNQSKNADELKEVIDNPHTPWTLQERNLLKPVVDNYQTIKSTETSLHQQLSEIEELLNPNQTVADNLLLASQQQKSIKNQLQTIETHLSQYHQLLESLSKTNGELSENEQQWQIKANQQVHELNELKKTLSAELNALEATQQACVDIVPNTIEKLEYFLTENTVQEIFIPKDVAFLQKTMGEILGTMTGLHDNLKTMATQIRSLFTNLSECISKVAKTLDKTSNCLKESEQLLAEYPNSAPGLIIK